jgi:hypothetical protein
MSVTATSLEDATSDSQVQWVYTVFSISSNQTITKLEFKSSDWGARGTLNPLKWQLEMRYYSLFVRYNTCASEACAYE